MATPQVFLHNKYMIPGESTAGGGGGVVIENDHIIAAISSMDSKFISSILQVRGLKFF